MRLLTGSTDPNLGNTESKTIVQNGVTIVLHSTNGRDWFMSPDTMLATAKRTTEIAYLSARQKSWLDMIELPTGGADIRAAYRMGGRS